jgi:hypothetical protein
MKWKPDRVDTIGFYCAGAAMYLVILGTLPFLNYGDSFSTIVAVFELAPLILVSLVAGPLATYSVVTTTIRFALRQNGRSVGALRSVVLLVILVADALLTYGQILAWSHQSEQHPLAHQPVYGIYQTIAGVSSLALTVTVCSVVLGVTLYALSLGTWSLFRRRWATLPCIALIVLGFACNKFGDRANDILTVKSCSPNSYRPVDGGVASVCPLDSSWLGFADYVVIDWTDTSERAVAERVRPNLNAIGCKVSAQRVIPGYYRVITGC